MVHFKLGEFRLDLFLKKGTESRPVCQRLRHPQILSVTCST